MTNKQLRTKISALFGRIRAGKYKCRCGGTLKAQTMCEDGRASSETVLLHCSRGQCLISTGWRAGYDLLEAFKEWRRMQKR